LSRDSSRDGYTQGGVGQNDLPLNEKRSTNNTKMQAVMNTIDLGPEVFCDHTLSAKKSGEGRKIEMEKDHAKGTRESMVDLKTRGT